MQSKKFNLVTGLIVVSIAAFGIFLITYLTKVVRTNFFGKADQTPMYLALLDPNYQISSKAKKVILTPVGNFASQYSPWIISRSGWGTKLMFYCKNTLINGVASDRVWRAELDKNNLSLLNDNLVIDGTRGTDDDLSCSPGVYIDSKNVWHMYYVTANRNDPLKLFLYHATSVDPGIKWTKVGKVTGGFPQPFPGYLESPSPILVNGEINLYYVGTNHKLYRSKSTNGYDFSSPEQINTPEGASSGHVIFDGGSYYYFYALNTAGVLQAPNTIRVSVSNDGKNFISKQTLVLSNGSDWDGSHAWSPTAEILNNVIRLYYAGNNGTYANFVSNTSIGYQDFSVTNASKVALTRFWSDYFSDTYLTVNAQEQTDLAKSGWLKKQDIGFAYQQSKPDTLPLYQFWSDVYKDHYYSTSDIEKQDLVNHGWRYDGVVAYLPATSSTNTTPLYKIACGPQNNKHYYVFTQDTTEKSSLIKNGCSDLGVLGNVFK